MGAQKIHFAGLKVKMTRALITTGYGGSTHGGDALTRILNNEARQQNIRREHALNSEGSFEL